jgi:hypothetical protein
MVRQILLPLCLRMSDEPLWRAYKPLHIMRHMLRVCVLEFSLGDEGSEEKDKHPSGGSGELDATGVECRLLHMLLPLLFLETAHLVERGVTAGLHPTCRAPHPCARPNPDPTPATRVAGARVCALGLRALRDSRSRIERTYPLGIGEDKQTSSRPPPIQPRTVSTYNYSDDDRSCPP